MIEGDRVQKPTRPTPTPNSTPVPKLVLDWERRAKILEQDVKNQEETINRQADIIESERGRRTFLSEQVKDLTVRLNRQTDAVEAQAQEIVDLKEELHQQDERIKLLEARIKTLGVLVTS